MSNFKGTKCKLEPSFNGYYHQVIGMSGNMKVTISVFNHYITDGEDENVVTDYSKGAECKANALLISKAPEMLEMLEELVCDLSEENLSSAMNDTIKRAEQLIKQSTKI